MKKMTIAAAVLLLQGCASTSNLNPSSALSARVQEAIAANTNTNTKLVYLRNVRTSPVQLYQGAGAASLAGLDPTLVGAAVKLAQTGVEQVGNGFRASLEQGNKTVRNTVNEFTEALVIGNLDNAGVKDVVAGFQSAAAPLGAQAVLPSPVAAPTPATPLTPQAIPASVLMGLPDGSTVKEDGAIQLPEPVPFEQGTNTVNQSEELLPPPPEGKE